MYLLELLREIPDNRNAKGIRFPLAEIVFISVLGAACGYTSYRKLETFMNCKWDIFRKLLNLKSKEAPKYNGIRSILITVESQALESVFRNHSFNLVNYDSVEHIASDGKTIKGSRDNVKNTPALQFLNLFAVNENIIMAHEVINNKTNEIPVFQELMLDLNLSKKIFTADALHCQKKH